MLACAFKHIEPILSPLLLFKRLAEKCAKVKTLSCEEQLLVKKLRENSLSHLEVANVSGYCENA